MLKNRKLQKGFTIVELLIVIVVIGILAALVLNTFAGVQQRGRDTERQTDINAIATQLEAYYANNSAYPSIVQLQSADWIQANLKGVDLGAFKSPQDSAANSIAGTASTTKYGYNVVPLAPTSCNTAAATPTSTLGTCTGFTLTSVKEGGGTITKESLNKPAAS
jgi:prepilin-type N-terminal cleavage/methylation domain-containing protein